MEKTETRPWDPAEHLETKEDMVAYLNVALEEGDLSLIMAVLGDIARARRMTVVAQETGLGRESLYKSLSVNGNPEFATVLKVVHTLGLRLQATTRPIGRLGKPATAPRLLSGPASISSYGTSPASPESRNMPLHGATAVPI